MNPLAEALNESIQANNPFAFQSLSRRGKEIFFPSKGIIGQTAEASGVRYNATIGIALEEDKTPMHFRLFDDLIHLHPKDIYPYASTYGKKELRERWLRMMREKNPSLQSECSLPVVTCGLTHALHIASHLFLDPNDELLLTDKFWGNYKLTFEMADGVRLVQFPTFQGQGFDVSSFRKALRTSSRSKLAVLLNFPNNPAGYTPTESEVQEITQALHNHAEKGNTIVAILDDAYFGLVYEEGLYKESLFGTLANLHERIIAVKIDGATKEDFVWGHRIGFITFAWKGITKESADAIASKAAGVLRGNISNVPHLSQSLLLEAYDAPTYHEEKDRAFIVLQKRYQEVKRVLTEHDEYQEYFEALPFNSGYFMCVQLTEGLDAEAVRKKLIADHDTGVIALGTMIRIAYSSLPLADIETLFQNLYDTCHSLSLSHVSHESLCRSAV